MHEFDVLVTQWVNGLAGTSPISDQLLILVSSVGVPALVLAVAVQRWARSDRPYIRHVVASAGLSFL
jgi:undecaprenyl-diphosphatase